MSDFKKFLQQRYKPGSDRISLGANISIEQLSTRLFNALDASESNATPPVVGLYGEWGSGKTFWMEQVRWNIIERHYLVTGDVSKVDRHIVPIFFNAWRFEKEEHLIVPLLKSVATELKAFAAQHKSETGLAKRFLNAAKDVGLSAAALTYSFTKEFEADLIKLGFGVQAKGSVFSALEDAQARQKAWKETLQNSIEGVYSAAEKLDSNYFDFHQQLETLLTGKGADQPIRLLFLIDDLDRCLPEKAVEMLESIKLFLEVDGTAFVVGVDDEVVERGIAHRYRDYGDKDKQLPITGHEYLEKIITLPIRLDRRDDQDIEAFIKHKGLTQLHALLDQSDDQKTDSDTNLDGVDKSSGADSLQKVIKHLPNVPRKIIRLEEMFGYRLQVIEAELDSKLAFNDKLALLRLICVQLMAPEIYRIGQRGEPRIFGFLAELHQEAGNQDTSFEWGAFAQYKHYLEASLNKKIERRGDGADGVNGVKGNAEVREKISEKRSEDALESKHGKSPAAVRETIEKHYIPLLAALDATKKSRSGFDPSAFLTDWKPKNCNYWYQFFGHANEFASDDVERDNTRLQGVESDWIYQPTQRQRAVFLAALATNSETQWQSVSKEVGIKRLDSGFAAELEPILRKALSNMDTSTRLGWLQNNGVLFEAAAFELLAKALSQTSNKTLNDGDKQPFPPEWSNYQDMQTVFDDDKNYSPQTRLIAGDFMGFLSFGKEAELEKKVATV